ncbi:MAG: hypothetical protein INH41_24970 [Myxococcaceae bacterium]|jgi:hypothetical protein|nr:hypothetical protein [Myxococcaceae bacterium]MCA3015653.1 hypothetical protein [Myxococcaceae bacterium]
MPSLHNQTATFFFIPDAARANDRTTRVTTPPPPTATLPVRVTWVR